MPRSALIHRAWLATAAALAVYWLAMFTGTHVPNPGAIAQGTNDKVMHFIAYAGLAALISLAWAVQRLERRQPGGSPESWRQFAQRFFQQRIPWLNYLVVGSVVSFYGTFDEVTQRATGRTCDLLDWRADTIGATVALVLFALGMRIGRAKFGDEPLPGR